MPRVGLGGSGRDLEVGRQGRLGQRSAGVASLDEPGGLRRTTRWPSRGARPRSRRSPQASPERLAGATGTRRREWRSSTRTAASAYETVRLSRSRRIERSVRNFEPGAKVRRQCGVVLSLGHRRGEQLERPRPVRDAVEPLDPGAALGLPDGELRERACPRARLPAESAPAAGSRRRRARLPRRRGFHDEARVVEVAPDLSEQPPRAEPERGEQRVERGHAGEAGASAPEREVIGPEDLGRPSASRRDRRSPDPAGSSWRSRRARAR